LKDIQNTLAQMNVDGLNNSDIFHRMAAQAAEYQDAIGDARQATRLLSSDTASLDAGIEAFSAIAGAATIATGVMGLFGNENKEIENAILKVQSALGILNGVQALSNTLNKDSILMLKIKQIQELASAQSTAVNSAATTGNTIATNVNTASLKLWNTAKAIGKALLGDFSGLLIVGAGALATYAIATSINVDAEKEHQKALDDSSKSASSFITTLSNTFSQLMTDYVKLKSEWKTLASTHQKNQWIKDNESKLNELGIAVSGVNSVEEAFKKNTNAVVNSFVARAKAAAYLSKITDEYKKQIELIDKINSQQSKATAEAAKRQKVNAGDEITDDTYKNSRYGGVEGDGKWHFSAKGSEIYNSGKSDGNKYIEGLQSQLKSSQSKVATYTSQMMSELEKAPKVVKNSSEKKTKTKKEKKKTEKKVAVFNENATTLEGMQDNVTVLSDKLKKLDVNSSEFKEVSTEIQKWKEKIDVVQKSLEKIEKPKFEDNSIGYYEDEISKLNSRLKNENLSIDARIEIKSQISDIQNQIDSLTDTATIKVRKVDVETQNKIDSYANANTNINSIKEQQEIGIIDKSQAESEIAELNSQLQELGLQPIKINLESNIEEKLNAASGAIDSIGGSLSSIGSNLGIPELDVAGMMAQSVATMISGYATATSQAAALGPWAWISFAALGAAQLAAIIGQVKSMGSYANGGVIGGGSTHGDMLTAQVNSGEMILNGKQQKRLFNLINGGGVGINGNGNQEVTFKIEGSTLKGVLNNYNSKRSKIR
jgi:phage tail tape measure protein